jgi:hypothetical protein
MENVCCLRISMEKIYFLRVSMENACCLRVNVGTFGKRVSYLVGLHEYASPQKRVLASRFLAMDYSGFKTSCHII